MSDAKIKRTKVDIQKEALAKLKAEAADKRKQIEILEARNKKSNKIKQREVDKRLKLHTGGMVNMVGLHRYIYSADEVRDNPQDALIANLLVGSLLKLSRDLESASIDDLKRLWSAGREFRKQQQSDRQLAEINKNLSELEEYVKSLPKP